MREWQLVNRKGSAVNQFRLETFPDNFNRGIAFGYRCNNLDGFGEKRPLQTGIWCEFIEQIPDADIRIGFCR